MKKTLLPLVAGLVIGGAATWWILRPHDDSRPEAAAAVAKPHSTAGGELKLTPAQQTGSSLTTVAPASMQLPPEARAYGRVLDLSPLIAAVAEVETAQSALAAAEKEFNRVRTLHTEGENASAQAVETAEAALQRDRVALLAARSRLTAGWGRALAEKATLALLEEALQQGWGLVRIDSTPGSNPVVPIAARVGALTDNSQLTAVELLGPAPSTDPQLQGTGWLALWREHALPPGATIRATLTLPGEPQKALVLPRAAFVRHEGSTWVYVQTGTGSYERRRVELARPLPDGYALAGGVEAGDKVVVVGAQQLLSTELQAAAGAKP